MDFQPPFKMKEVKSYKTETALEKKGNFSHDYVGTSRTKKALEALSRSPLSCEPGLDPEHAQHGHRFLKCNCFLAAAGDITSQILLSLGNSSPANTPKVYFPIKQQEYSWGELGTG